MLQRGEVAFYQKHNLPLPRKHYDVRHAERMKLRPGLEMYLQTCDKCGVEMLSAYAEKEGKKVYCEEGYQQEMYG